METALTDARIAAFWSKVAKAGPDDCWLWTGWRNVEGYGRFDVGKAKPLATHIALILNGQPRPPHPNNKALHGDCSNPACCNPRHLRWGTSKLNAADRDRLARRTPLTGEANGNSKLTLEQVRHIRSSPLSQRALAKELGVSQPCVGMVRRRVVWDHVD